MTLSEKIKRWFTYQPPKEGQPARYARIRDAAQAYATILDEVCPDSEERDIAIQKLSEVVMWANASIARNE